MNIKAQWVKSFEEKLWQYHTCDWQYGNDNQDYSFQLASAYFDWSDDGQPEESVEEAFERYLDSITDEHNN